MTEDNDLIAAMIESGQGAITGRSRTWLNSQVAQALATARAEAEVLREAVQTVVDALTKHHQWHAAQTDPDPEHGFIPANEYADSSLYDATVNALWVAQKATGPHDFAARSKGPTQ